MAFSVCALSDSGQHAVEPMSRTVSPAAPLLSPDIWTETFARLQDRHGETGLWDDAKARQQQRELHQLKVVCKQFSDIFTSQPELVQKIHLHSGFPSSAVTTLLAWLQRSSGSIQVFTSSCCDTSLTHTVVARPLASSPPLRIINISNASSWSIQLTAAFTGLEKCALQCHSTRFQDLDLTPLQGLPKLRHLYLQGFSFKQLHCLPSLTSLRCKNAFVMMKPRCSFKSNLQCLTLKRSFLRGVHARGLQACTALTELGLNAASLRGLRHHQQLTSDLATFPDGMKLLTRLCKLTLSTDTNASLMFIGRPKLESIAGITSLQDLSISFGTCCSDFIKCLTSLTNLSRLGVTGLSSDADPLPMLTTDFDWCGLQALQILCILRCRVVLGQGVASLLYLSYLGHISFEGSTFQGNNAVECLAALSYHFARLHPAAKLNSPTRDVLEYFR